VRATPLTSTGPQNLHSTRAPGRPVPHTRWTKHRGLVRGDPFRNRLGDLPGGRGASSPYREYRVSPPPGTAGPGVRRIVANPATGETYYTWTHYGDAGSPAFVRIR
jgi:hypothetical protein